jgi:hypothetical protein
MLLIGVAGIGFFRAQAAAYRHDTAAKVPKFELFHVAESNLMRLPRSLAHSLSCCGCIPPSLR